MSIAVVNSYLKARRSDWAIQGCPPSGAVPAEMLRGPADDRDHAFSIIVDAKKVDDAITALNGDFGLNLKQDDFNRLADAKYGNTLINLSFAEENTISRKLAPPSLGLRQP